MANFGPRKATRHDKTVTVTTAKDAAESSEIDLRGWDGGTIFMPAAWTTADLGATVCYESGGTFVSLRDRSNSYGTDVSIDAAAASVAYPFPAFWFGASFLKLHSHDGSGSDTTQAAARTLRVTLKS